MSDELKDFRYYADKAEMVLGVAIDDDTTERGEDVCVRVAAVYAELANAAPKTEFKYKVTVDGAGGYGKDAECPEGSQAR
jgi:hypothetical protein